MFSQFIDVNIAVQSKFGIVQNYCGNNNQEISGKVLSFKPPNFKESVKSNMSKYDRNLDQNDLNAFPD